MSLTSSQEDSFRGFSDDGQNTLLESGIQTIAMAKEEQDGLIRCLARLERFVESPTPTSKEQVDARLKRLEQCWDQFQKISKEINRLDDVKNKRSNNEKFDDFDERVMVLTGNLKSMRWCPKQESASDSKKLSKETIKLPKIVLPEFTGKYDQWLQFRDMYEQMIHNNEALSKVEKFYYLKCSLKGDALKVIEGFPICAVSYDAAWDAIVKRFANPYLQKKRHANELLNWPRMRKLNAVSINTLIDGFERHTKLLQQLGETPSMWGVILTQLLTSKLDEATQREWERSVEGENETNYADLIKFLRGQVRILEALGENKSDQRTQPAVVNTPKFTVHVAAEEKKTKCSVCRQEHSTAKCERFLAAPVKERLKIARASELCLNCLGKGHYRSQCSSIVRCRACKGMHHSLLHLWLPKKDDVPGRSVQASEMNNGPFQNEVQGTYVENAALTMAVTRPTVSCGVLSTALVRIKSRSGELCEARALLDNGSQVNILTERLCKKLNLIRHSSDVKLIGIGHCEVSGEAAVTTEVLSQATEYARKMEFLVLDCITQSLQPVSVPTSCVPENGQIADSGWSKGGEIDILLGSQYFFEFLVLDGGRPKIHKVSDEHPYFVNTVFGWVLAGPRQPRHEPSAVCSHLSLVDQIERFWSIEELHEGKRLTQDEQDCELSFVQSHSRDETGRYVVKLPMKINGIEMLGESQSMAERRFLQLEKRLSKDKVLHAEYCASFKQYLDLGYLKEVFPNTSEEQCNARLKAYYLPHHPVVKQASTSTKVRPVFDGSAKTSSGFALNECLLNGPVLQDTLFNMVLRFRMHPIALMADIEKMYLQVRVHRDHTSLQRIVWRFSEHDNLKHYELQRVTFGLTPSSFLATRVLFQLAADEGDHFPLGQRALQYCFYVDDYIGGADNEDEAVRLVSELVELLKKGGFNLRKWNSNVPSTLRNVDPGDKDNSNLVNIGHADEVKALGVCWDPEADELGIAVQLAEDAPIDHPTRRTVFSAIAKLFDPLGIIAPIIAWAKIMMQRLWIATKEWDDPIPHELADQWSLFERQLCHIRQIRVRRYVLCVEKTSTQLHCFADASEAAYGACIYLRVKGQESLVKVILLAAKSKVAPLKKLSLPRLELCAAVLGAKLWKTIYDALNDQTVESFFWSDSTVVLNWLRAPSYTWATFVANRVAMVQDLTKGNHWQHVKGSENPADILSRGALPSQLTKEWFSGPNWLSNERWSFPEDVSSAEETQLERKRQVVVTTVEAAEHPILDKYSSYWKCGRVTAYCIRFIRRCRKETVPTGPISYKEFNEAIRRLVATLQRIEFPVEVQELACGRELPKRSKLRRIRPFLDGEGVMRVGGRFSQTNMRYNTKHPMILPSKCNLTKIIAKAYHEVSLHGGPRLTLATMRQDFWPVNGKSLANSIHKNCLVCFKANPRPITQPIGQLPEKRVTPARPFLTTGIDYCGPVYLKPVHRRAAAQKSYIAVFVCFCTKAVHLELVEDMTTPAFLAAFRRFISRRGYPVDVYTDNGLNFRGAQRELEEVYRLMSIDSFRNTVQEDTLSSGIRWHFIPPRAPNFGGLWEAAVKSAKKTLNKLFVSQRLSFADMCTVLTQIEAQLNSRPLTPLSEDPGELNVLTPGHFLIGEALLNLPDANNTMIPENRLKHFERLQQLVQRHWQQWQKEYLCELHNINQKMRCARKVEIGQMVILKEDALPSEWFLGRIVGIHPGRDGVVRVVTVKTTKGEYKRPITRICLLPSDEDE